MDGVKESSPQTPPWPKLQAGATHDSGGENNKPTIQTDGPALVDALLAAIPHEAQRRAWHPKDAGGRVCLGIEAGELAKVIGTAAAVATITANPPPLLRAPVAWLLARARLARTATSVTAEVLPEAPIPPGQAQTQPTHNSPTGELPQIAGSPGPVALAARRPQLPRRPPATIAVSTPVAEAVAAIATLTAAGSWRTELERAARGEPVAATAIPTIRALTTALATALDAGAPRLTPRSLVAQITARPLPPAVRDLPNLLAARALKVATEPNDGHPDVDGGVDQPAPPDPGRTRSRHQPGPPATERCGNCSDGLVIDDNGRAAPCPYCAPSTIPRRQPAAAQTQKGDPVRLGDTLTTLTTAHA